MHNGKFIINLYVYYTNILNYLKNGRIVLFSKIIQIIFNYLLIIFIGVTAELRPNPSSSKLSHLSMFIPDLN